MIVPYDYAAPVVLLLWLVSAALMALSFYWRRRETTLIRSAMLIACAGIAVMALFIAMMWLDVARPLFKTLGETRLWYATLLPLLGVVICWRIQSRLIFLVSLLFAAMFLVINYIHPENFSRDLMPALQSPWFFPHVIVYMLAYPCLGLSAVMAAVSAGRTLYRQQPVSSREMVRMDHLIVAAFALLTLGLVFGALWAKEAWGHYWTWDPKETWAFLTWLIYLTYLHLRRQHRRNASLALAFNLTGFAVMLICWFGVNLLPTAAQSVHVYR